jgi:hypothetical protein
MYPQANPTHVGRLKSRTKALPTPCRLPIGGWHQPSTQPISPRYLASSRVEATPIPTKSPPLPLHSPCRPISQHGQFTDAYTIPWTPPTTLATLLPLPSLILSTRGDLARMAWTQGVLMLSYVGEQGYVGFHLQFFFYLAPIRLIDCSIVLFVDYR